MISQWFVSNKGIIDDNKTNNRILKLTSAGQVLPVNEREFFYFVLMAHNALISASTLSNLYPALKKNQETIDLAKEVSKHGRILAGEDILIEERVAVERTTSRQLAFSL